MQGAPSSLASLVSLRAFATTAALALSLAACDVVPGYGANGELGRGQFTYACTSDDQACVQSARTDLVRLPYAVAEGATFQLGFVPREGARAALRIEPATGLSVREANGTFVAQRVGTEAVLARASGVGGEEVVDLVHVRVQAPTRVRFLVREQELVLWLGQRERLVAVVEGEALPRARPGHDRRALLGGIAAHTTSANAGVVAVEQEPHGAVRLVATGLGETSVTATYGTLSTTLPVRVVARETTFAQRSATHAALH